MYREWENGTHLTQNSSCLLCDSQAYTDSDPRTPIALVICPTCGKYRFNSGAWGLVESLKESNSRDRHKLSHFTRSVSERAFGRRDNSFFPIYSINEFQEVLHRPDPQVAEKLQLLLSYLASVSGFPGETKRFDPANDYPIMCAKNGREAEFHLKFLENEELVSLAHVVRGEAGIINFVLSGKGWREAERRKQVGADSSDAFIAMSFDPSRNTIHDVIDKAIKDAGYNPIRVDRLEHLNRIDDEIIARIRRSKFMVADFTQHRAGVYFESGFMLGLGRPVIWVCEKTDLSTLHFDTRQYNMIDYSSAEDLQERLLNRIFANLGKGPENTD